MAVMSSEVAGKILDAFGLSGRRVTKLSIHLEANEIATLEVTSLAEKEEFGEFAEVMRRFELNERIQQIPSMTLYERIDWMAYEAKAEIEKMAARALCAIGVGAR